MRRKAPSSVIGEFLRRHQADIFCVQESKIPLSQLESRSEPLQCAHVEGYESFWSCCVDTSKRGFNGVTTYVKKGMVASADSKPLGSPDLDDQGRCVMTDHGEFVIFNVYVPAGGGQPLSYKMKFLNALRRAMKRQRDQYHKKVILAGDLNISHGKKDVHWASLCLDIDQLCQEVEQLPPGQLVEDLPEWKLQLAKSWPKIEATLQTKKVVPVQTTNPRTNQQFEKYRMTVQVDGKQVFLGGYEESPRHCEHYFDFGPSYYECDDSKERILAEKKNMIDVQTVAELMEKVAGITWEVEHQRKIAASYGKRSEVAPPRKWLNEILHKDGMVDAFRHFYPDAEGRFTCWDQFRNRRYENEGARIDYTIVDQSLLKYVQQGNVTALRCSCFGKHDPNSEEAALCATTANGRFQAVPFNGGGIVEATQEALDSQFGEKHTGMIYTPPSFSDHIATSLLLDDTCCSFGLTLQENDKTTRAAQPHKKLRTISSFFGAASVTTCLEGGVKKITGNSFTASSKPPPAKKKRTMHDFLAKPAIKGEAGAKSNVCESSNVATKLTASAMASSSTNFAKSSNDRKPLKNNGNSKKTAIPKNSIRNFFN
ncbi:exodeoxyribonuclease III [Nitzschia inconspicua]|uniref:Exodeoxyribonuclease III n=1 Tax=Nitzschia inconspicua TaxID=303405 RepID=A0A9K3LQE0_9STRA|nr:exodeoxyribonuclease III [Nitzschia inconspicua]